MNSFSKRKTLVNRIPKSSQFFSEIREQTLHGNYQGETQLRLGLYFPNGELRAFFDSEKNSIGLVIPVDERVYSNLRNDTRSKAIQIIRLRSDGKPTIRLALHSLKFSSIFYIFVDEYMHDVVSSGSIEADHVFLMLHKWRQLFEKNFPTERRLSPEEQMGLLCELEVLLKLVELNGPAALEYWVGPNRSPHDFELDSKSLECKATGSSNELRIKIHGAKQLERLSEKALLLVVRRYRLDPSGTFSLPIAFDLLQQRLPSHIDRLIEKFQDLEYPIPDGFSSEFLNFTPLEAFEFEVVEDFPRVKGANIDSRIKQLSYVLELSSPESIPGYKKHVDHISESDLNR
ncbi:hypothetical protein JOF49_001883 [Corynebacterium suicordis]|nr:hypothetical protein [Corynebacterium suicordis]